MLRRLRRHFEDISWEDAASPSFWVRFARRQVRLTFYMLRELVRNRCMQQASALTYTTLLSLVPLMAVAFSVFRGFGAMEKWEDRVQQEIFRVVLADALVNGESKQATEDDVAGDDLAELADLTAPEILAAADGLAREGASGKAFRRYVAALSKGADAEAVRKGMMLLAFSAVAKPGDSLANVEPGARRRYFEAAGLLAADSEGAPENGRPPVEGAANGAGPPAELQNAADEHRAKAQKAWAARDSAGAEAEYWSALGRSCDAVLASAWSGTPDGFIAAVEHHDRMRGDLADFLLESGRIAAQTFLARPEGDQAEAQMAEAVGRLEKAALMLEEPGQAHGLLGRVYETGGENEKALRAYSMSARAAGAATARGLSLRVVDHLRRFREQVGRAEIGVIGTLFLIVTAIALLNTIERTLNHIWKVAQRRAFWSKFTSYCTLIWLGPVLFGASAWLGAKMKAYITSSVSSVPMLGPAVDFILLAGTYCLPFLTLWLVLFFLYRFLPNARVRSSSAAWGAFWGALLIQPARMLFSAYAVRAFSYERIYGSLGVVPLFLLWIWLLWVIVLFGAEIAFTSQHMGLLRYQDKLRHLSSLFVDRYLAARMMMYVALRFWRSGEPASAEWLGDTLHIPTEEAADTARRLAKLGMLRPMGEEMDQFHPARDLSRLKLSDVLSIMDRYRDEYRSVRPEDNVFEDRLETVFRSAIEAQDHALGGMTLHDLLAECDEDAARDAPPKAGGDAGQPVS